jgi:hypothetical protein
LSLVHFMLHNSGMGEPPNRRWFQFSLRTLLIGVTLLALPLTM